MAIGPGNTPTTKFKNALANENVNLRQVSNRLSLLYPFRKVGSSPSNRGAHNSTSKESSKTHTKHEKWKKAKNKIHHPCLHVFQFPHGSSPRPKPNSPLRAVTPPHSERPIRTTSSDHNKKVKATGKSQANKTLTFSNEANKSSLTRSSSMSKQESVTSAASIYSKKRGISETEDEISMPQRQKDRRISTSSETKDFRDRLSAVKLGSTKNHPSMEVEYNESEILNSTVASEKSAGNTKKTQNDRPPNSSISPNKKVECWLAHLAHKQRINTDTLSNIPHSRSGHSGMTFLFFLLETKLKLISIKFLGKIAAKSNIMSQLIKAAVYPVDYPENIVDDSMKETIRRELNLHLSLREENRDGDKNNAVGFNSVITRNGQMIVTCYNARSAEWLKRTINRIDFQGIFGVELTCIQAKNAFKLPSFVLYLPVDNLDFENAEKIMKTAHSIDTKGWKLLHQTKMDKGSGSRFILLGSDELKNFFMRNKVGKLDFQHMLYSRKISLRLIPEVQGPLEGTKTNPLIFSQTNNLNFLNLKHELMMNLVKRKELNVVLNKKLKRRRFRTPSRKRSWTRTSWKHGLKSILEHHEMPDATMNSYEPAPEHKGTNEIFFNQRELFSTIEFNSRHSFFILYSPETFSIANKNKNSSCKQSNRKNKWNKSILNELNVIFTLMNPNKKSHPTAHLVSRRSLVPDPSLEWHPLRLWLPSMAATIGDVGGDPVAERNQFKGRYHPKSDSTFSYFDSRSSPDLSCFCRWLTRASVSTSGSIWLRLLPCWVRNQDVAITNMDKCQPICTTDLSRLLTDSFLHRRWCFEGIAGFVGGGLTASWRLKFAEAVLNQPSHPQSELPPSSPQLPDKFLDTNNQFNLTNTLILIGGVYLIDYGD